MNSNTRPLRSVRADVSKLGVELALCCGQLDHDVVLAVTERLATVYRALRMAGLVTPHGFRGHDAGVDGMAVNGL